MIPSVPLLLTASLLSLPYCNAIPQAGALTQPADVYTVASSSSELDALDKLSGSFQRRAAAFTDEYTVVNLSPELDALDKMSGNT
ncbi:hypothetical protein LOZ66_006417 [Ophidiomyces ophidiicola]|nr:hypothetical protein LOZ66_006417 [Ophidiomyces ophidiicola]